MDKTKFSKKISVRWVLEEVGIVVKYVDNCSLPSGFVLGIKAIVDNNPSVPWVSYYIIYIYIYIYKYIYIYSVLFACWFCFVLFFVFYGQCIRNLSTKRDSKAILTLNNSASDNS